MRSIMLKGRNAKPSSNLHCSNAFNKSNSKKYDPTRSLPYKCEPFAEANLHENLSDWLADNNNHEDANAGIEHVIEVNEYESTLIVKSTSANKITPAAVPN